MEIIVPRDRLGKFELVVITKNETIVTGNEYQITNLCAKSVSTRDIQDHLQGFYGIEVFPTLISNGATVDKAASMVIRVDPDGNKDVLGILDWKE